MWVVPGMGFAGMVLGMRASRSLQIFLLLLAFWLLVNPLSQWTLEERWDSLAR